MRFTIPLFALAAAIAGAVPAGSSQASAHGKWDVTFTRSRTVMSSYSENLQIWFTPPDGSSRTNVSCTANGYRVNPPVFAEGCTYPYMSYNYTDDSVLEIKQRYWDTKTGPSDASGSAKLYLKTGADGACHGSGTIYANLTTPIPIECRLDDENKFPCNF
ncbi:hypothetical protein ACJQWK_01524 [Exserohilum turcicum]|uniref:AA1-like domain-containing protein n=1 Tax=Exserohilum turcicum (strain 28A) TaxID=671987 RepID=R0KJI4_EXST2|nr:uncharacterized protein SETTUDRAFT_27588 [Exserohilum turcica Et28A]EOA88127.1 hypothetical protein SETTUDRAFT_27588 [Exserohilum turcica Et28A]